MSRRHPLIFCLALVALISQAPLFGACFVSCDDGTSCSAAGPNAVCVCRPEACCGRSFVCEATLDLQAEIFAPAAPSTVPAVPAAGQ